MIKIHGSGKVGAAYDISDNVGVHLTAEKHGLKLLPDVLMMIAPTKSRTEGYAENTLGRCARLKAAPLEQKPEACATSTAQEACVSTRAAEVSLPSPLQATIP